MMKMADAILYDTSKIPETENLYYKDHRLLNFNAKVLHIFENVIDSKKKNIVCLSQSAFYPTSGG